MSCLSLKWLAGVAMTTMVVVVATVTLAITYNASLATVRTAAQEIAASIVDNVATRVSSDMNITEDALNQINSMALIDGHRIPIDDPSQSDWYDAWMLPMRTTYIAPRHSIYAYAVVFEDSSLVVLGDWWVNSSYLYAYAMSGTSFAATGNTTLSTLWLREKGTLNLWDVSKQGPGFYPLYWGDERSPFYYARKAALCTASTPQCGWSLPFVETFTFHEGDFVVEASCCVRNASGHMLGMSSAASRLLQFDESLRNAVVTPNTYIFIVDNTLRLVATSFPYPVQHFYNPNETNVTARLEEGCVGSNTNTIGTLYDKIGCRGYALTYPYAPLNAIAAADPSFLSQPARDERSTYLASDRYFYISVRIPSTFPPVFTMNLVLFLPEQDVLGGLTNAAITGVIICGVVFVVAAVFANILIHVLFPTLTYFTGVKIICLDNGREGDDREGNADAESDGGGGDDDDGDVEMSPIVPSTSENTVAPSPSQAESFAMVHTALLVDIVGFGALCDRVPASKLTSLFRHYVERMSAVVQRHGGTVERFLGDCLVSYFATPTQHEMRAGLCALALQCETRSDPLSGEFKAATEQALRIRCGIATGVAGRSGTCEAATQASQLLSLNRVWGTEVLMSDSTAQACMDIFVLRRLPCKLSAVSFVSNSAVFDLVGLTRDEPPSTSFAELDQLIQSGRLHSIASVRALCWATMYSTAAKQYDRDAIGLCRRLLREMERDASLRSAGYLHRACFERLRDACDQHLGSNPNPPSTAARYDGSTR